jgi:hypothetical protein
MKVKKRPIIGAILMVASVLAAILIQVFTDRVLMFHSGPTEVSANPNLSAQPILSITTSEVIGLHWRYVIPLAAGFVIGLVCCAWPTRKQPRLGDQAQPKTPAH